MSDEQTKGDEEPTPPSEAPGLSNTERQAFETFAPEAVITLAEEPDYPPPGSVPVPLPLAAPKTYPSPAVSEIAPGSGTMLGDTKVTLTGSGLYRLSIVRIGGVIAQTIGAREPDELRVLSPPAEKAGEVDVTVENPFVPPLVMPKAYRYEPLAPPRITGVAPDHVATKGGSEISITGQGFVKTTAVFLDGKPAPRVRFVSETAMDVTTPAGEDGHLVDVSVKNPDGQSAVARRAFVFDKRFG